MDSATTYHLLKSIHIIAVISWMAGMLYLPRIFVYHCQVKHGSEASDKFIIMERKLLRLIINPAMIVTFVVGIWLAYYTESYTQVWFHIKALLLFILAGIHGMMAKYRKDFESGMNRKSEKFYRIFNEIPAVLMIVIVFLAVFKP